MDFGVIHTRVDQEIYPYLEQIRVANPRSHKGQNGKMIVIGGSRLFHASPIWSAEIASSIVDMVHFSSTEENNEIIHSLKKIFRSGMVVHQKDILSYVEEDDVILIGPGMMRDSITKSEPHQNTFEEILSITQEAEYARALIHFLLGKYPKKQFVIDAGALQMMNSEWLSQLMIPAVITPHAQEFKRLFGISLEPLSAQEVARCVMDTAKRFRCIIILKYINDYVSDGFRTIEIIGGNAGLTKGGTGDVLAGLVASLATKTHPFVSAVSGSILVKRTADQLFQKKGSWYSISDLISFIPEVFHELVYNRSS